MNKLKIPIFLIIIISFFAVSFLMSTPVHADYYCENCAANHACDGITEIVTKFANESCSINFFREDEGTGLSLTEILKFDVNTNTTFNKMWFGTDGVNSVRTIFDALLPIASILAVIFFLLELSERVFSEQFNAEQLALLFVRLGLALLVISNGFDILTVINSICAEVFRIVQEMSEIVANSNALCLFDTVKDMNMFEKAGYVLSLLFSYLFMLIAWVIILVTAWKRVFEIVIYAMFFPIGISDVVRGGLDSSGVSYMKKMAAKFLQGTIALAIIIGYNLVSALALSSGSASGSFGAVILALTVMTLMLQTESIASAIIGS